MVRLKVRKLNALQRPSALSTRRIYAKILRVLFYGDSLMNEKNAPTHSIKMLM
jgi:hypothetical protein